MLGSLLRFANHPLTEGVGEDYATAEAVLQAAHALQSALANLQGSVNYHDTEHALARLDQAVRVLARSKDVHARKLAASATVLRAQVIRALDAVDDADEAFGKQLRDLQSLSKVFIRQAAA